jgi:predicted PurR-regulated permease PerM
LVKDGPGLRTWLENLVPPPLRGDFIHLRDEIYTIWSSFFRGQLLLALVVAVIFITVGAILGLPFALVMGLLAGLLEFLPSIGHGIWMCIAAILSFSIGSTWLPIPNLVFTVIVVVLHLIYQQFDLNYLIPRIIGRSVRLPPLVVILGIVAGALFAGILGIFLAAPTIASARVLGRYVFANLFDLDPFPDSIVSQLPPPNPRWWRADPPDDSINRPRKA